MDNVFNQNLLSNNFLNLLQSSEGFDTKIIVGEEPNTKEFKVHSIILSSRSAYFKSALSSRWAKRENGIIAFNKPNISPLVFEVLIKCKTSKSFIFSLLSFSKGAIPRLSRISTKNEAIIWCNNKGPCFGSQDLWIQNNSSRGSASGISKKHQSA
ncbi:btb/poz domain-containing protein 19-like [Gigaspora margarita]|uniref:Btb/poz domain-containing protein 19-like n=1 Tax=Gigaspora margarita TaxID=4874 RepID=A0A8H4B412_GIGMA|nr:btb/poz domain-containing protein 19-like [Gigaspora margarita]